MLCAACTVITGDLGRIIAIEIEGTAAKSIEENDAITLSATAIDAAGDTVPDAVIVWELLVADSADVDGGFDLDSATGVIRALSPGNGRVRARVEELRSDTISIVVTGAPDSIAAGGDTLITMESDSILSPTITVAISDLTTDPSVSQPLAAKPVTFRVADLFPGGSDSQGFFLTGGDSIPGVDPHSVTVRTNGSGTASIMVRRFAGSILPDSAVVEAVAVTAVGDTVSGSPVRFIVVFESDP